VLDADRDLELQALDWAVGYVRYHEARDPGAVVAKAHRLLGRRRRAA
jgi:hypothetical protein